MPAAPVVPWALVVPVKQLVLAKTRLAKYGDQIRQDLALAFALDVVTAALTCDLVVAVLVVTDDERAGAALAALGATVVPDSPAAGLNPALEHGAGLLRAERDTGVAALSADLPALRGPDLAAALAAVPAGGRAFVADAGGTGTTMLAAAPGVALAPAFGQRSRVLHLAAQAAELAAAPGLRLDVDTPDDLREALRLGVGAATAAIAYSLA